MYKTMDTTVLFKVILLQYGRRNGLGLLPYDTKLV